MKESFLWTRESFSYYIFFLLKTTRLINVGSLKYKDNALITWKNEKPLCEKQSDGQLEVFDRDSETEVIEKFDN